MGSYTTEMAVLIVNMSYFHVTSDTYNIFSNDISKYFFGCLKGKGTHA